MSVIPDRTPDGTIISRNPAFCDKDGFRLRNEGISGVVIAGQVSDVELKIEEERHINGVQLILSGHHEDDKIDFLVVDVDGLLGEPGRVLDNFGVNWNVIPDRSDQGAIVYPYKAKLIAGLYIAIRYHSFGSQNVKVKCNLILHKKD